jgi:hypothetical protein
MYSIDPGMEFEHGLHLTAEHIGNRGRHAAIKHEQHVGDRFYGRRPRCKGKESDLSQQWSDPPT